MIDGRMFIVGNILGVLFALMIIMHQKQKEHDELYKWLTDPVAMRRMGSHLQDGAIFHISVDTIGADLGKKDPK